MKATLKYALSSPKKMGMIAKMIRGKKVSDALDLLRILPKRSARILYRVVHSALANARQQHGYEKDSLLVSTIEVGRGPKLKRMKFVGRARIHGYQKYRTFVHVSLGTAVK